MTNYKEVLLDTDLNKLKLTNFLKNKQDYFLLSIEVRKLQLSDERIKSIIQLLEGESTAESYGLLSILYSLIGNFTGSSETAHACFVSEKNTPIVWKISAFGHYCNTIIDLFNENLKRNDYYNASLELEKLEKFIDRNRALDNMSIFNNTHNTLTMRLEDHKIFYEKYLEAENNIQKNQWRIIEIVGIFSAIIVLFTSSLTIAVKLNVTDAIGLLAALAVILILFVLSFRLMFGVKANERVVIVLLILILLSSIFLNIKLWIY